MQNSMAIMENSVSMMKKVLFVTLWLVLASFAFGDSDSDEIANILQDKQKIAEEEEYWIRFGFGGNCYRPNASENDKPCSKQEQRYYKFGKEYFRPVWYGEYRDDDGNIKFQRYCFNGDGAQGCEYALKKPLKLKGKLIFSTNYNIADCDEAIHISFEADDMSVATSHFGASNVILEHNAQTYKMIKSQIPQWYLDGLAGEVGFEVELEVATRAYTQDSPNDTYSSFGMFYTACYQDDEVTLMTKNLKILRKIDEKMFDRDKYQYFEYNGVNINAVSDNFKIKLDTTDDFVNLRQSPNGKILAKIYKKDFDGSAVFNLTYGEYNTPDNYYKNDLQANIQDMIGKPRGKRPERLDPKKPRWIKVVYFPPNVTKAEQAIVGYIHNSQMKTEDE